MRTLSGAALAALTIAIAGCSVLDAPAPSATPPGEPAALPRPTAASGRIGDPVEIGPITLVVESAAAWPQDEQTLGPDIRGLSVLVRLKSSTPALALDASDFQLVDTDTGARYAAGARPASRDLALPVVLGAAATEGLLSFSPPRTGTYSLRVTVSPTATGMVELGRIRTGTPSADAVDPAAPSEAPVASPGATTARVDCVKVTGGRWNPVGDDNKLPTLNREYVEIASTCATATPMGGWMLTDRFRQNAITFPADFVLAAGANLRVYSGKGTPTADRLYFGRTSKEVWGNKAPETAYLKDASGATVHVYTPY